MLAERAKDITCPEVQIWAGEKIWPEERFRFYRARSQGSF